MAVAAVDQDHLAEWRTAVAHHRALESAAQGHAASLAHARGVVASVEAKLAKAKEVVAAAETQYGDALTSSSGDDDVKIHQQGLKNARDAQELAEDRVSASRAAVDRLIGEDREFAGSLAAGKAGIYTAAYPLFVGEVRKLLEKATRQRAELTQTRASITALMSDLDLSLLPRSLEGTIHQEASFLWLHWHVALPFNSIDAPRQHATPSPTTKAWAEYRAALVAGIEASPPELDSAAEAPQVAT
jgi:hypothetical protein